MSDNAKWIEYKGHKIFYTNFTGLDEAGFLEAMDDTMRQIKDLEPGPTLLFLINVTKTHTTLSIKDKIRDVVNTMSKHKYVVGVVGISPMMKLIAKAFKLNMYIAKNEEDAKEWLAMQADKAAQPVG